MVLVLSRRVLLIAAVALLALAAFVLCRNVFFRDAGATPILHSDTDKTIVIQIDEKKLYLLEDDAVVKKYTIASGKPGFSSPIGNWKIVSKGWNWGKGFGSRWLGLNVPWGTYGIHGTNQEWKIGQAVSHGCIRMRNADVKDLFGRVEIGTPVIIRNGPYGPFGMGFKTLEPGQRGADVMAVQKRLKELEYYNGPESGIYGESLKIALHKFQRDHGLTVENKITHDDYTAMGFLEFD